MYDAEIVSMGCPASYRPKDCLSIRRYADPTRDELSSKSWQA